MRGRTALLLLFTLSLTLGFGVHPCAAAEERHAGEQTEISTAMSSCHAQTAPEPTGEGHAGQRSSDHPCPHVCHATALPAVTPPFLTVQAVTALIVAHVETAFTAPARSIDHVPLA